MLRILLIILLSVPLYVQAQTLKGLVLNSDYEPLVGVSVFWLESKVGTITDSTGYFEIQKDWNSELLVAEYVGFGSDTLLIEKQTRVSFTLQSINELASITVSGERSGVIISNEQTIKTERITEVELTKAACCDLAGCFETQTTVQPQVTNVITNSKELRIMGLSGVYNQVLIDGLPMIQGLTYTYGISTIPGTLVENIYVSKGANSVLQGYESISGQIND